MSDCTHDCGSCSSDCKEREKESMLMAPHAKSSIKKVYAIVSGKGGVGKSIVSSMMAVLMQRKGYHSAILDLDITGPSIPKAFGLVEGVAGAEDGIYPARTDTGIDVMSINLMLTNETDPVLWRGPVIAGTAGQFWSEVIWEDVDYMFVDMPPGTGDVALTAFQSLPLDGIVIVASPQELVSMIVEKAVKMANIMKIPIVGLVENMSYVSCPDCGKKIHLFGESNIDSVAEKYGLKVFARIPIDPKLAKACDEGMIESFEGDWLDSLADEIEKK